MKSLKLPEVSTKKKLVAVIVTSIILIAGALFLFININKKSDVEARKSVEKAVQLFKEDKKKNKAKAVRLLNKSIKQSKTPVLMKEKKAAICQQFEHFDCAISVYQDLSKSSGTNKGFYKKKLGDSYRYSNKNKEALQTYEEVNKDCRSKDCTGVSTDELNYFIKQLKENKAIVETQ